MKTAMIKACQDMKLSSHTTNTLLAGGLGAGIGAYKTYKDLHEEADLEDYLKTMARYGLTGAVVGRAASQLLHNPVKELSPQKFSDNFKPKPAVETFIPSSENLQDILDKHKQKVLAPNNVVNLGTKGPTYNNFSDYLKDSMTWLDEKGKPMKTFDAYMKHHYPDVSPENMDLFTNAKKIFEVLKPEHNLTPDQLKKLETHADVIKMLPEAAKTTGRKHLLESGIPEDLLLSLGF